MITNSLAMAGTSPGAGGWGSFWVWSGSDLKIGTVVLLHYPTQLQLHPRLYFLKRNLTPENVRMPEAPMQKNTSQCNTSPILHSTTHKQHETTYRTEQNRTEQYRTEQNRKQAQNVEKEAGGSRRRHVAGRGTLAPSTQVGWGTGELPRTGHPLLAICQVFVEPLNSPPI